MAPPTARFSYAVPTGETVKSITLTTQAGNGTAVVNADGTYTYTPKSGYAGTDTFTYTVTDTNGQTSTATVTVTVTPLADTANAATLNINEDSGTTSGTLSYAAPTGESITKIVLTSQATNGTAVVNADGTYTYTPKSGYAGTDTFTYTVTDTNGQTSDRDHHREGRPVGRHRQCGDIERQREQRHDVGHPLVCRPRPVNPSPRSC